MGKKRTAPIPLPEDDRRDVTIKVKVTRAQWHAIKGLAAADSRTLSAWMQWLAKCEIEARKS